MTKLDRRSLLPASCTLLVLTLAASAGLADAIRPVPWLAGVTQNSVYASLEANNTTPAVVDYGLTAVYDSQASTESIDATTNATSVHNVKLTGLAPNTQYHYRVTHGSSVSADYTFWTAPEPGTPAHWGFAADSRSNPGTHNSIAAKIASHNPRMMVYGGDLCANSSYGSYNGEWFVSNQNALNATAPFVNAAGNHEGWSTNTRAFTESPSGTDGESGSGYFSFDYGDTHILVLNNEVSYSNGSAQWNFAKSDLESTDRIFKVVAFHKSAYAFGGHGNNSGMVAMTQQIFEPNGVSIVLTGHSHFYQHNLVNGIHHMVIGSFGAPLRTPGSASYTTWSERTTSYGIFDTTPSGLTLRTYRGDGSPIETITVIPEPSTLLLAAAGLLALVPFLRRYRKKAA